jgi:hypothetical protein
MPLGNLLCADIIHQQMELAAPQDRLNEGKRKKFVVNVQWHG